MLFALRLHLKINMVANNVLFNIFFILVEKTKTLLWLEIIWLYPFTFQNKIPTFKCSVQPGAALSSRGVSKIERKEKQLFLT